MKGSYLLMDSIVDIFVPSTIHYGVYVITNSQNTILYVGRSDTNLQRRIKEHIGEKIDYNKFYYEEASSKKEAYEKECYLWHQYYPRDNDIHPDYPDDMRYLKCPVSTCKKHY